MAWARLDDTFHDHPKVVAAGVEAVGLWTLCLTWCYRNRAKGVGFGYIPADLPQRFAGRRGKGYAAKLEQVGLWDADSAAGGWWIHDAEDYAKADEISAKRSEAGKRGAESRWQGHSKTDGKPDGKALATDSSRAGAGASALARPEPEPVLGPVDPCPPVPERASQNGVGAITEAVRAIRPGWTADAVQAALRAATGNGRSWDHACRALLEVARLPDSTHPGRLSHDGPWWQTTAKPPAPPGIDEQEMQRDIEQAAARRAEFDRQHERAAQLDAMGDRGQAFRQQARADIRDRGDMPAGPLIDRVALEIAQRQETTA